MQGNGASSANVLKSIFTPRVLKPIFSAASAMFFNELPLLVVSDKRRIFSKEIDRL